MGMKTYLLLLLLICGISCKKSEQKIIDEMNEITTYTDSAVMNAEIQIESPDDNVAIQVEVWDIGKIPGTVTVTLSPDGILRISGKGDMRVDYCCEEGSCTPWERLEEHTHVIIEEGVTSIGNCSFGYSYAGPAYVTIPNSVVSIGDFAFSYSYSLKSVIIPNNMANIGIFAFSDCKGLTSITVLNPVPLPISRNVFRDINENACLYVPEGSIDAYRSAEYWKDFKCIKPIP